MTVGLVLTLTIAVIVAIVLWIVMCGNIISFVAAVLLGLSCWCKNPKRVFVYQFVENLFLSLSSVVFGSYSAAVSTLLSTAKSLVIVKGRYTKKTMIFFAVTIAVLGVLTNTKGLIGLLPVIATVQFTYCNYKLTDIKGIKWTFIINLLIWDVYAFWIKDFSSGIAWAITLIVTVVSLLTINAKEAAEGQAQQ